MLILHFERPRAEAANHCTVNVAPNRSQRRIVRVELFICFVSFQFQWEGNWWIVTLMCWLLSLCHYITSTSHHCSCSLPFPFWSFFISFHCAMCDACDVMKWVMTDEGGHVLYRVAQDKMHIWKLNNFYFTPDKLYIHDPRHMRIWCGCTWVLIRLHSWVMWMSFSLYTVAVDRRPYHSIPLG
jgi:hypothetical protein